MEGLLGLRSPPENGVGHRACGWDTLLVFHGATRVLSVQGGRGGFHRARLPGQSLLQCHRENGHSTVQALGLPHKTTMPCQSPALPACWLAGHPKISTGFNPPSVLAFSC